MSSSSKYSSASPRMAVMQTIVHAVSERAGWYHDAITWKLSSGRLGSVERLVGGWAKVFVTLGVEVGMERVAQDEIVERRHRED
jgi:hypothetical protein